MITLVTIAATAGARMVKPIMGDERIRVSLALFTYIAGNIPVYVGITPWLSLQLYHIQNAMATMSNIFLAEHAYH